MSTIKLLDTQVAAVDEARIVTPDLGDVSGIGSSETAVKPQVESCMAPDAVVLTLRGRCSARDLTVGDLVLTRDNGYQPILWIGRPDGAGCKDARLRLSKDCIDKGCPDRDLELSARQRILMTLRGSMAESFSSDAPVEAFVRARDLVGLNGVAEVQAVEEKDVQILTRRHEVILVNGVWTETFQPDCAQLKALPKDQRDALEQVLPQVSEQAEGKAFAAARAAMPAPILQEILRQRSA